MKERGANKMDLTKFYDDLKSELDNDTKPTVAVGGPIAPLNSPVGQSEWKAHCNSEANGLIDKCRKHILLDIYCKIIPLDADFVKGNMGMMKSDIDSMLDNKGMTATQYFKSCSTNTNKAPLVEFVLWATNQIGKQFLEEAEEKLKDAKENDLDVPAPDAPDTDADNVNDQLVDITDDPEYKTFIDRLKENTERKIVEDVTKIITDKKEEKKMSFNPKPVADIEAEMESTTSQALHYLQKYLMKESVDADMDDLMGLAIRESTMNVIDSVFNQPGSDYKSFVSRLRNHNGVVVNESAVSYLIEAAKTPEEVNQVVNGAKKEMDDKIDKNLKASEVVDATKKNNEEEKK